MGVVLYYQVKNEYGDDTFIVEKPFKYITVFEAEFDENRVSFQLKNFTVIPLEALETATLENGTKVFDQEMVEACHRWSLGSIGIRQELAVLVCQGAMAIVPVSMMGPPETQIYITQEEAILHMNNTPLKLAKDRSSYDYNAMLRHSEPKVAELRSCVSWLAFMQHALALHTTSPLHTTHRLLVVCDVSLRIGEVSGLLSHRLVDFEFIKSRPKIFSGPMQRQILHPDDPSAHSEAHAYQTDCIANGTASKESYLVPVLLQIGEGKNTFIVCP